MLDTVKRVTDATDSTFGIRATMQDFTPLLEAAEIIPVNPRIIACTLSALEKQDVNYLLIEHMVADDPIIAAELLARANALNTSESTIVDSLSKAVGCLTKHEIRQVLLSLSKRCCFRASKSFPMPLFWSYSLAVANAAVQIAGMTAAKGSASRPGAPGRAKSAFYTAGLLHAIGEAAMSLQIPLQMRLINERADVLSPLRAKRQRAMLGYSYAQASAAILRAQGVNESIVSAIEYHDTPFHSGVNDPIAFVLELAVWRAKTLMVNANDRQRALSYPDAAGIALNIEMEALLQQALQIGASELWHVPLDVLPQTKSYVGRFGTQRT